MALFLVHSSIVVYTHVTEGVEQSRILVVATVVDGGGVVTGVVTGGVVTGVIGVVGSGVAGPVVSPPVGHSYHVLVDVTHSSGVNTLDSGQTSVVVDVLVQLSRASSTMGGGVTTDGAAVIGADNC